jgi:hypothetical protein
MAVYEALIATPRKELANESEHIALIDDIANMGNNISYLESTMGDYGYAFELLVPNNMDERELKDELRDIVNYYGLVLTDLYFLHY